MNDKIHTNRPPISVTAHSGIDSKNPQSSIAVTISVGSTVVADEPNPAAFKAQVNAYKAQTEKVDAATAQVETLAANVKAMTETAQAVHKSEEAYLAGAKQLAAQVAELNKVYGNMLNALS